MKFKFELSEFELRTMIGISIWTSFLLLYLPFLIIYRFLFGKIKIENIGFSSTILFSLISVYILIYIIKYINIYLLVLNELMFELIKEEYYYLKPISNLVLFSVSLFFLSYKLLKFLFQGKLKDGLKKYKSVIFSNF
jgi:hypothetical protein